jgi:hypothetical protein
MPKMQAGEDYSMPPICGKAISNPTLVVMLSSIPTPTVLGVNELMPFG